MVASGETTGIAVLRAIDRLVCMRSQFCVGRLRGATCLAGASIVAGALSVGAFALSVAPTPAVAGFDCGNASDFNSAEGAGSGGSGGGNVACGFSASAPGNNASNSAFGNSPDEFTATFTKDGYQPANIRVGTHVSGSGVAAGTGNILVGGVVGVGVDAYNGANLDHDMNPVIAHLSPVLAPAPTPAKKHHRVPVS